MYAELFCLILARNYDAFRAGNKTEITPPNLGVRMYSKHHPQNQSSMSRQPSSMKDAALPCSCV